MDGWGEALAAASDADLRIVPGVELSAEHDGASLHVLGYWVDPAHEGLRAELRRLHDTRFRRGEMIVEKLRALGHDISFERVRRIAGDDLIARPHIAQAMVETGIVATERDAFDSYISDDGPAYVPKHALAPVDALALIRDAGGACVLAHPGMWRGADSVPDALITFKNSVTDGGSGASAPTTTFDAANDIWMTTVGKTTAGQYFLSAVPFTVPSGASDCHGARYDYRLGSETTRPDLVDELHRRAGP